MGYPYSLILLSFAVAVYTVARYRPLREASIAAVTALLALLVHLLTNPAVLSGAVGLAPATAWVAVPFAIGATRRMAAEAAAQARAEVLRQRVDDERLRVAQEVHDIVGHGLAAIKMQADIALHVLGRQPEQAQAALDVISRTSGEALDELRTTLAVAAAAAGSGRAGRNDAVGITVTNTAPGGGSGGVRDGSGIADMRRRVALLGGEFTAGATEDGRFEVHAVLPTGGQP